MWWSSLDGVSGVVNLLRMLAWMSYTKQSIYTHDHSTGYGPV